MSKGFYGFGIITKDGKPLMEGDNPIIDAKAEELGVIADLPGTVGMSIAPCRVVSLFWSDDREEEL